MEIRSATKDDEKFLHEMLFEAARWTPDWRPEEVEAVLPDAELARYVEEWGERPGDAGVVAEIDGVPVGAAWYRLFTAEDGSLAFVAEDVPEVAIAVAPLHRRKGAGSSLINALIERAREDGHVGLSLFVAVYNRSRKMYEQAGFTKVGERGDSWVMRLDLAPSRAG